MTKNGRGEEGGFPSFFGTTQVGCLLVGGDGPASLAPGRGSQKAPSSPCPLSSGTCFLFLSGCHDVPKNISRAEDLRIALKDFRGGGAFLISERKKEGFAPKGVCVGGGVDSEGPAAAACAKPTASCPAAFLSLSLHRPSLEARRWASSSHPPPPSARPRRQLKIGLREGEPSQYAPPPRNHSPAPATETLHKKDGSHLAPWRGGRKPSKCPRSKGAAASAASEEQVATG